MTIQEFVLELILLLVKFVVPLLSVWISTNLVKWLKERLGNERYQQLVALADIAVHAVEAKLGGGGNGAVKKREVELWLANKLKWATPDMIDAVVDAIWYEMNQAQKKGRDLDGNQ